MVLVPEQLEDVSATALITKLRASLDGCEVLLYLHLQEMPARPNEVGPAGADGVVVKGDAVALGGVLLRHRATMFPPAC